MGEDGLDSRTVDHAVTNFGLLFHCSAFDGWADDDQETRFRSLVAAGPSSASWLAAPTGRALGYRFAGSGEAFTTELTDQVGVMLGSTAAETVEAVLDWVPDASLELETTFGEPTRYRVTASLSSFETLREVLTALNVPEDALDRALRYEDTPGATLDGVGVVAADERPWTVLVRTALDSDSPARPDGPVGEAPLVVAEAVLDWTATWIRRPGLHDEALIDWQDARGFDVAEARTVGEIHGSLGRTGPDTLVWEQGDLQASLVYAYDDPVALD